MSGSGQIGGDDEAAAVSAKNRAAELVGTVVAGRYRIEEVLAMGGMGAVFRAEHVHMRKRVAVKVLHPNTQGFPELVSRFERESVVGAHITHPNVVSASDFGHLDDGSCYLVLEYVEGITLHDLLKREPIPVERAVEIARQLAAALGAAHELEIIHRDLKPRNVMLVEYAGRDTVKLIDFGFAKVPLKRFSSSRVSDEVTLTTTGVVFGTVAYMAPETARGMHAVTAKSDLYALGMILYEMLAGRHAFDATEPTALFLAHRTTKPPRFKERAPERRIPAALEAVVMRMLEKDPAARYATAGDFVTALDKATGGAPPPSARPSGSGAARATGAPDEPSGADHSPAPAAVEARAEAPRPPPAARPGMLVAPGVLARGAGVRSGPPPQPVGAQGNAAESAGAPTPARAPPTGAASSLAVAKGSAAPAAATATAAASASAAASAAASSALPRVAAVDGLDGPGWRGVLKEATDAKDTLRAATAILALAQIEPDAFGPKDLGPLAASVAIAIELGDRATADKVYALLEGPTLGSGAADVLYQMQSFFGGSRGAKRASAILHQPAVLARATPALRIALELREAPCGARAALFERAGAEGDERAQAILIDMRSSDCDPNAGACCARFDPKAEAALEQLRVRLAK